MKKITIIVLLISLQTYPQSEDCNKFMFEKLTSIFHSVNDGFIDCENLSDIVFENVINRNDFDYIVKQQNNFLKVYRYKDGQKEFLINKRLVNSCVMGCYTWYLQKTWVELENENENEIVVYSIGLKSGHFDEPPSDYYQKTTYKFIEEFAIKSDTEIYSEENNKANKFNDNGVYNKSIYNTKKYIGIIEKKYQATYNNKYAFRLDIMERFFKNFYIN